VFEYFDDDGDQLLNKVEFWSCCTGIGVVLEEEAIDSSIAELDETGDGCISMEEFTPFMVRGVVNTVCKHRVFCEGIR
jgi:Ca2+-binding EF-hand superfamily protein